ncbi:hypothetical protein ACFOQM_09670 [Paenibacillus sp. GCM10012307]|uniref:Uncharacterized protein n=1 Tax=Paenibacillus roseus TaxID=2798579 RepID=A0A934MQ59_9BACL|nr:hypothetical protein [Paenibacillus roseus]MBJ6361553.1 hypothetical protein [Paenibacillus roseus]
MRYSVCAFQEIETIAGPDERPIRPIDAGTSEKAEKIARELYKEGEYSSIYIHYTHPSSDCYWNPGVGFEPVAKNWLRHFEDEAN